MRTGTMSSLAAAAAVAVLPQMAQAQDAAGVTWENATELSFVSTGGNASSSTLGVKSALSGTSGPHELKLELGAVRGETNLTTRTATGTAQSPVINETSISQLTAENYFARGRYDRSFTEAFLFAGVGWERNTFAGIQNRYSGVVGLGRTWVDGETGHFKTDVGTTYTIQKDVDPAPGVDDAFVGARVSIDAARRLSASVGYASVLVLDESVEDTGDLRADWINSVSVALSQSLALKTSLQLLYDKRPSLLPVPLLDGTGAPTGTEVLTPGDELDSIMTLTLVITL